MADIYETFNKKLLKSKFDTFDITQTLYQQVNNDYWRDKSNLWRIISAACNDAASDFYIKLREYVKNLADIDVCTIHNLKSIALSVDAKHLLDFTLILLTFPVLLRLLLDILSIKPSKLLLSDQKLHYSALLTLLGNIDRRSCLVRPLKLSPTLLIDIYDNLDKILKWFEYNTIIPDGTIKFIFDRDKNNNFSDAFIAEAKLYNEDLKDNSTIWYYGLVNTNWNGHYENNLADVEYIDSTKIAELTQTTLSDILQLKVKDILNNIRYFKDLIENSDEEINKTTQLSQFLGFEFKYAKKQENIKLTIINFFNTPSIVIFVNGKYVLNPFFALIEIVKARLYSSNTSIPLVPYYKEKGDNEVTIYMTDICLNMIQTIKKNSLCYINNFMLFHIYNLIYTKIINSKLQDDFKVNFITDSDKNIVDIKNITYVSKYSLMTYEEFVPAVSAWISSNELHEFLGEEIEEDTKRITNFEEVLISNKVNVSHYKKEYEDFIQYLSLVKAIIKLKDKQELRLPYLIYRYNCNAFDSAERSLDIHSNTYIANDFNLFYRLLLGINENGTFNSNNYIQRVAEYLTDICIKISYIRELIKGLVQQYSFIGTLRIVTDVVRDYFVKNFSKRSDWNYVSDLFKNKDNSQYLKTLLQLNGQNNNLQFKVELKLYFDQTAYLNILTKLPPVQNGYRTVLTTFISTYTTTTDIISTYTLNEDLLSTIYDNYDFQIPSTLYPLHGIVTSYITPAVSANGTSLYGLLVQNSVDSSQYYSSNQSDVICSFVAVSEPVTTEYPVYIQTTPTSSRIELPLTAFQKYCFDSLGLNRDQYNTLKDNINDITVTSQILTSKYYFDDNGNVINYDTAPYYSVIATLKNNTTVSTIITTSNTTKTKIPYSSLDKTPLCTLHFTAPTSILLVPEQTVTGLYYNYGPSSIIIPKGTPVSTLVPAGTQLSTEITSTLYVPIWVDGNELVDKSNARFWLKNIDYLTWEDLSSEISFYLRYFDLLANAPTNELKIKVYRDQIYPLLSLIWDKNATSGMLDGVNNAVHLLYSGKYPGIQLERNIGNQDFTTIAPLPYIPNLIEVNTYDNDDSYIVKPLYDNISYYMNMFMAQMFNMYKIQADNRFAIAIDGWKNTHIELKGYCSKYLRSSNTITTLGEMDSRLDVDGPWVYSSLKAFLGLKDYSKESIDYYVNNYFFNLTNSVINKNIKNKLFRYSQEIINKGNGWKLYSFLRDANDNQFSLFKQTNNFKYEDAGLIWVRMKNFPLSMPLMNRNIVIDFKDVKYQNDLYDTLLYNLSGKYANMFKQLTNNTIQFGIVKNIMWILGWTNYTMNANQRLIFNLNSKALKLVSFKFNLREDLTLLIDPISVKSYYLLDRYVTYDTPLKQNDTLNNFNLFVGVNYKEQSDSIDFVLYDKSNKVFNIHNYKLDSLDVDTYWVDYKDLLLPAFNILQINALINTKELNTTSGELGYSYLIDTIDVGKLCIGTIYYNNNYKISGYCGRKEDSAKSIYLQLLTGTTKFNLDIVESTLSSLDSIELISTYINNGELVSTTLTTTFIPLNFSEDTTNTISSYANIWRLGSDENNTGIAFEVYDFSDKEDLSSNFVIKELNTLNLKTLNNVLHIDCLLLTKQVVDSNNNVIYLNQIKTISTSITGITIELDNINSDYIAIQLMFPYCHMLKNNHLLINSIATTLGSYKSLTVKKDEKGVYEEPNGMKLLTSVIDPLVVCDDDFEELITDSNSYFYRNGLRVLLKEHYNLYKNLFKNTTGTYDFYLYYDKYVDAKYNNEPISTQQNYLELYNLQMAKLNDIVAFAPVVNEFILLPLKIIFNFGDIFNFDINAANSNGTNYFDLDINTYIDTYLEKYKKVGWKCGLRETDYINWITRDLRFGGPLIVTVDIDKYKDNYIDSHNMSYPNYSLDIIVNACWFSLSVIQSLNPHILVNWKGFTYQYIIEDIQTNQNCCDFPFLKIKVGLNNNTLNCYRKVLIPACIHNKNTTLCLFGFIRMWEDEVIDDLFIKAQYKNINENWLVDLDLIHAFRNYLQFEAACNDQLTATKILSLVGVYNKNEAIDLKLSLNWNKTLILKTKEENELLKEFEFYIKKIILV